MHLVTMATASSDCDEDITDYRDQMMDNLLNKIAHSGAYFKSQQIDDPELTYDEKRQIAEEILRRKGPAQFLARFHEHLSRDDLAYFERFRDNYEVAFYVREIENVNSKTAKIRVKNRRYEALKRLIETGDYFSDAEMRRRNPLLFEQMVGQYMTDDEKEEMDKIDKSDLRLTTILMEHIDRDHEENLRRAQEASEAVEESSDEDSSGDEVEEICRRPPTISAEEKHIFREEFLSTMYQSFLDGKDTEFNYGTVDTNTEYDALEETDQDAEDSYFDAEEPFNDTEM